MNERADVLFLFHRSRTIVGTRRRTSHQHTAWALQPNHQRSASARDGRRGLVRNPVFPDGGAPLDGLYDTVINPLATVPSDTVAVDAVSASANDAGGSGGVQLDLHMYVDSDPARMTHA
eukprot:m.36223 g.36223  ORF g.36223 m.36223 type:complete len:119 (+) comp14467_c0_seq2:1148-1504(+)